MAEKFSLTGLSGVHVQNEQKKSPVDKQPFKMPVLTIVSYSLAGICAFFLIAFALDESMSVSWFFISETVAFILIPTLVKQGFSKTGKFLLIIYVDIAIIILSSIFADAGDVQYFLIPTMGLAILLFDYDELNLRNISIFISVISYFVVDYITIDRVSLTEETIDYVKMGITAAAFITTWIIFNTFSESKERAETKIREFLEKEQELNKQLSDQRDELESNVEQLEEAKEELVKTSRAKTDFLATMSHEIRTPMNAILGMSHLLKEDNPREDQLESINILDFSGKTLLALIDDILDFSKIDAGKIEFEETNFELKKLVSTISETFKITANNKKVELITEIGEKLPKYLTGDPARLTQILNNLVSNALKFTEKGWVKVLVQLLGETEKHARVRFQVIDTGIGIEEDRLGSVFESFTQASTKTKRLFGGTGLGLTISKQLVELQGGTISVESKLGKGSTFTVILEFAKTSRKEVSDAGIVEEEGGNLQGIKVLVAEDNLINQKVIQSFLSRWNVEAKMVENGVEAIKELTANKFDILLMDLEMPEMDGFEAAAAIRKLDKSAKRNIPIVALTAAALDEVKEKVFAVGMTDYVTKPFNPVELRKKIAELTQK